MKLGIHAKDDIRRRMAGLSGAACARTADALAILYGVSVSEVYDESRDVRPRRAKRADSGREYRMPEETLGRWNALTVGQGVSIRQAREILIAEGHDLPDKSTLSRFNRRRGVSRRDRDRDLRPFVRFEAPRPNRLWQMDSSGSTMFYIRPDGSIEYVSPLKHTKNKEQRAPNVWMILIVDDFSRAAYVELVTGNSTQTWLQAFAHAASEKPGHTYPFCGLPDEIYTDNDAVVKSARFERVLSMFAPPVVVTKALPYIGKRSKGKVERFVRTVKDDFESVHRAIEVPHLARVIDQRHHKPTEWRNLDEANAAIRQWLLEYNNRIHGTTSQAPFERWVNGWSADARPRVVDPETIEGIVLMDQREARINGDMTVRVEKKSYRLPSIEPFVSMTGKKITVWWSPKYERSVHVDYQGTSYEIHEVGAPLEWGVFASHPMPEREKIKIATAIAPDAPHASGVGARTKPVPSDSRGMPAPAWLSPKPEIASTPNVAPPPSVMKTKIQAKLWAREHGHVHRQISAAELAEIDALFNGRDSVTLDELIRWAEVRRMPARIAAGGAA